MTINPTWLCIELPTGEYSRTLDFQRRLVQARKDHFIDHDIVIITEHLPVYTLGHRGSREHLLVSDAVLAGAGIPVVPVERGGDITFHGPGQLVVYPIVHLCKSGLRIPEYISRLEEIMIRICGDWEITAERIPGKPGIWTGGDKIGSIGLAVRRGISFHGFSLNVNVSLDHFSWIHPCGLTNVQMTSMARKLGRDIPMKDIRYSAFSHIQQIFYVHLDRIDPGETLYQQTDGQVGYS
jgi:lipoyl(octanoyl) transferase